MKYTGISLEDGETINGPGYGFNKSMDLWCVKDESTNEYIPVEEVMDESGAMLESNIEEIDEEMESALEVIDGSETDEELELLADTIMAEEEEKCQCGKDADPNAPEDWEGYCSEECYTNNLLRGVDDAYMNMESATKCLLCGSDVEPDGPEEFDGYCSERCFETDKAIDKADMMETREG